MLFQARTGAPESAIQLLSAPGRTPGPGELGLKILAAPIHPIDVLRVRGHYPLALPLPGIPGSEGVAKVVALGPDVPPSWKRGDLCLLPPRFGSYRSDANLLAARAIPLPAQIDPLQASMLIINPLSADLLLDRCQDEGTTSFVNLPASGAVGQCLVALARHRGMRSVNLIRNPRWVPWLNSLDPKAEVEHLDDWVSRPIRCPPRVALDGLGGTYAHAVIQKLQHPGRLHVYGAASKCPPQIGLSELIFSGLCVHGFWLHRWMRAQSPKLVHQRIKKLAALMVSGQLKIKTAHAFALDHYKDAFAAARDPRTFGKVILLPNPHSFPAPTPGQRFLG